MRSRFFLLLCFFYVLFCFPQNKNSQLPLNTSQEKLIKEIDQATNEPRWVSEFKILNHFSSKKQLIDEVDKYYKLQPISLEKVKFYLFLGAYNYTIVEDYYDAEDSFLFCFEHKKLLSQNQQYALLTSLADVEKIQSNFSNAIYFYENILELAKSANDKHHQYNAYREIGVIYRDLNQLNKAEKYLLHSKKMQDELKVKGVDQMWIELHLGRLYRLKKNYALSRKYLDSAIKVSEDNLDKRLINYAYLEYIQYWIDTKNLKNANYVCSKSLQNLSEHESTSDKLILTNFYNLQGEIALLEKDNDKATASLHKAFLLGKETRAIVSTRLIAEKLLKIINPSHKLYPEVANYIIESYDLQDEFFERSKRFAKQLDDLNNLETKIQSIEEVSGKRNIYIFLIIVFTFILLVSLYYLRKKVKQVNQQTQSLADINEKIQQSNGKLTQINEDLNQFSSVVAHDIKSSIVGLQFGIKKAVNDNNSELSSYERSHLKDIEREASKLFEYIDYLMFAAKNSNNTSLLPQKIDFQEVLLQLESTFQKKAHSLHIHFQYEDSLPDFTGYKIQFFQLFKALTEFAISRNTRDKLNITIEFYKEGNKLTIYFKDDNDPLDAGQTEKIQQSISNINVISLQDNSNIGLIICKKIVSNYNGTISVQPNPINGTTVCIELLEK